MSSLNSLAVVFALASAAPAQEPGKILRYTPPSHTFYCDVPAGWQPFEEEDSLGFGVHILGPDNPAGTFRTGIDIRWMEKGQPGFVSQKKFVDDMRRSDKQTGRAATVVHPMRISGILARTFEISENRRLPADTLPSTEEALHQYVAVIPSGESYYLVTLSSTRDVYLDYRELFIQFLKAFKPLGYK